MCTSSIHNRSTRTPLADRLHLCHREFERINGGSLVRDRLSLKTLREIRNGKMSPERNCQMWYAIQTRTRRERSTATLLIGKGYEIFLPTYVSRRLLSSRTGEVRSPLFPGYLFSRFDVHKRLPVLLTPGVIGVVGQGRVPITVPLSEISAIQSLVSSGGPVEPWPYLECGKRVQIGDHALRGLEGILIGHKGNHRVVVSVTLLRRSVALEIHRSCVIPIPSLCDVFAGSVPEGVLYEANA